MPSKGAVSESFNCHKFVAEIADSEEYLNIGLPLYEASVKCDCKAANAIFDKHPDMELVRFNITKRCETALHIAASAKGTKKVAEFVRNLVEKMTNEDLELVNYNNSTALYLAAVAGNIESVKIMMERNPTLDTIPGGGIHTLKMPLYAAALFGNKDVASYLYESSKDLADDRGWNEKNRTELLEKCVESDMFEE
nr:ankyrin repeat-containing domain, PGG domain protein [Tanacetum cinerariifolium]